MPSEDAGARETDIIAAYASLAKQLPAPTLERLALRMPSEKVRDVIALVASDGELDYQAVALAARDGRLGPPPEPHWMAALGRAVGLGGLDTSDRSVGAAILEATVDHLPPTPARQYRTLLAELLLAEGRYDRVHRMLIDHPALGEVNEGYLWTDLLNPNTPSPFRDAERWLEGIQRQFEARGVPGPAVDPGGGFPFDRLRGPSTAPTGGPLISVVLTTFRPTRGALLTAARSILNQTWRDLELLVVDDCSPAEFGPVLDEVEGVDERVTVIRLPENRGTYVARNAGMARARGEYLTGQDDDDWAHPERLARQVAPLLGDDGIPATLSTTITTDDNLLMLRPGYFPTRPNASSLMVRMETARRLGGFLAARKAADSEFRERIERAVGAPSLVLPEILSVVRIRTESLSRSEFRPGWHHPARRAFRASYQRWHATASPEELTLLPDRRTPIAIPARFRVHVEPRPNYDVVIAGDLRGGSAIGRAARDEALALRDAGLRVGILRLESLRYFEMRVTAINDALQDMVNDGAVTQLVEDDDVDARLVVVRQPHVLQFPASEATRIAARRVVIAGGRPQGDDDVPQLCDVGECTAAAERLFGVRPATHSVGLRLPPVIHPDEWLTERESTRSDRPVVGLVLESLPSLEPRSDRCLRALDDGSIDIRALGRPTDEARPSWVAFDEGEIAPRTFLNSIDFFVLCPHQLTDEGAERMVVEALAAGCVAILPPELRTVFKGAAVYARQGDVIQAVNRLHRDTGALRRQAAQAMARAADRFGPEHYVAAVRHLLA